MKDVLLAIDNGSQSIRALLFDLEGNLLHKTRVVFEPYHSPHPGWSEQDPEYFWTSLCRVCQQLWSETTITKDRIAGVALTTQRGTVINVDQAGKPLRPAVTWMDQRRTEGIPPLGGIWGLLFRIVGASPIIEYFQQEAEASWLSKNQPEIWNKTHKYLLLSGYLTHKLVGRFVDSTACQVAYIPFSSQHLNWAPSYSWHWQLLPITPAMLPELVPPAGVLGEITPAAAEATGIPAGLPLISAAADKACEVIGAGCLQPHVACLSYGTSATINTTNQRYFEAIRMIPPYPAAVPNHYSSEIQILRGYWMVSWFKNQFGHNEQQLALERGVDPEVLFDELIRDIPPGSMGLVLQPYWSPGIRLPGPEARGAVIGFSDFHTRAHLYRAILEGLAYALREGRDQIERVGKTKISELRVSGGGSQSDTAMQLTADIFNLPAARPHTYETSGLGAAIDAAVGLKLHRDFDQAVKAMTRVSQVFQPNPQTVQVYDDLYQNVYLQMYPRLQKLYNHIKQNAHHYRR